MGFDPHWDPLYSQVRADLHPRGATRRGVPAFSLCAVTERCDLPSVHPDAVTIAGGSPGT